MLSGLVRGILCRKLCREGSALSRALEAAGAGRRPRYCVALNVGDRDDRIVESCSNVSDAGLNILPGLLSVLGRVLGHET